MDTTTITSKILSLYADLPALSPSEALARSVAVAPDAYETSGAVRERALVIRSAAAALARRISTICTPQWLALPLHWYIELGEQLRR